MRPLLILRSRTVDKTDAACHSTCGVSKDEASWFETRRAAALLTMRNRHPCA
jgi:hypothetical protein